MDLIKCNKCGQYKEATLFTKKRGYRCLDCHCEYMKQWRLNNKENNVIKQRVSYIKKRDDILRKKAIFYQQNKERLIDKQRQYAAQHKEQKARYEAKYQVERTHNDANYCLAKRLRTRINHAIRGKSNLIDGLGCSIDDLRFYLENKFQEGMSWSNYGTWHIDHIIPLSSFDLTDPEQFKRACHYTNLQPLWAKDNLVKSNKLPEEYSNV